MRYTRRLDVDDDWARWLDTNRHKTVGEAVEHAEGMVRHWFDRREAGGYRRRFARKAIRGVRTFRTCPDRGLLVGDWLERGGLR